MHIRSPVSSCFDFVLFRDHVPVTDLLMSVKTEVGLFVDLRRAIGVGGYVFVCVL